MLNIERSPGVRKHFFEYAGLITHDSAKDRIWVQLEDVIVLTAAANEAEQISTVGDL
jgi:hypothetical protein